MLPNQVTVRQISGALRGVGFLPTPFVNNEEHCKLFIKFCLQLKFSTQEAVSQIEQERNFLERNKNVSASNTEIKG